MNDERHTLTADDRAVLATIDAVLADDPDAPPPDAPLADFARLLRDSAPAANDGFRQRLRADVLRAATAEQAEIAPPWWRRRLTRRQAVAAGIVGLGFGGAAITAAKLVARLNDEFSSTGGEELQGWAIDQATTVPLTVGPNTANWVGPSDARCSYQFLMIPRARWQNFERIALPQPEMGGAVPLGNGYTLPIPAHLPDGFHWQGVNAINDTTLGPGVGNTGSGARTGNFPWDRFPEHDHRLGAYLVGGDPADRFLILAQLRFDGHPNLSLSSLLYDSADQQIPYGIVVPPPAPGAPPPTPTPVPVNYASRVTAIALLQPAGGGAAVSIRSGAATIRDTNVRGQPARWFNGIWAPNGQWLDTDAWTTLVWEQNGLLYQLSGQQLPLDELIRIAESLPATP